MAYKVLSLAIVLPVTALLWWFFEPTLTPEPWMWIALGPAVALAFLVRFFFEWSLALLAFWITDTSGLNNLYMALFFFLAGRMAPISLLPSWGQAIANALPFRLMLAFPVELLMGRLTPEQVMDGFLTQILWIGLGWLTVHLVWTRASARYSAVGA
jgi:ABC-2 type transport system permease protein